MSSRILPYHEDDVIKRFTAGENQNLIAASYGKTHQAVSHFLRSRGITGASGGKHLRSQQKSHFKAIDRSARYLAKHGYTYEEYTKLRKSDAKMFRAYTEHRNNSEKINRKWEFTLKTWWTMWQSSGVWDKRGLGAEKFVMAILDTDKPLGPDNCAIMTHSACSSFTQRRYKGQKTYVPGVGVIGR